MAYVQQLEGLRREVRVSTASTLTFYPRSDGDGRVAIDNASLVVSLYDPAGTPIGGASAAVVTDANGAEAITISTPAMAELAENYRLTVQWRSGASGELTQQSLFFDVVTEPWGPTSVDIHAMRTLVPPIGDRLENQARKLNSTSPAVTITADELASSYGYHARVEIDGWVRARVLEEAGQALDVLERRKYSRPRLILDRERLHMVELKLAIAYVFRADMRRRDDAEDTAGALYAHWRDEAEQSFRALGPLAYDWTEQLVATEPKVVDLGRTVHMRRRQA